jgi:hypothetical protein
VPDPARETDAARLPGGEPSSTDEASEVRYLPVPAKPRPVEASPVRPLERLVVEPLPATIAAAAGGFLAGVASWVMVRMLRGRRSQRAVGRALTGRRRGKRLEVAGSRSFLVDIHMLRR